MFATRQWVGADAHQAQQTAHETAHLLGHGFGIAHIGGHGERTHHIEPNTRTRTRRVDGEGRALAQCADVGTAEVPPRQAVGPGLGLPRREIGHRLAGLFGISLVHPGLEVGRCQVGEGEAEVGEVALGVDEQCGHTGPQRLFDEHHAQAGLTRAGHANNHTVGGEIARSDGGGVAGALVRCGVYPSAKKKVSHSRKR